MTMRKTNPASLVYNPLEVARLGQEYIKYKHDNKQFGLPFFSHKMSDRVYPQFPGEMASIIARPGHAKTGVMMYWARTRAGFLKEHFPKRVVVYATWEQSVEELHSFHVSAEQHVSITRMAKGEMTEEEWEKSMTASAQRVSEPLWFIGHSVMRKSGREPITTETLTRAIETILDSEEGLEIDSLFVDYLQRIPPVHRTESPVVAYSSIVDELKNLALGFGLPLTVGVQASREVENLKLPIPEMQHAQWTSNIEQSSDRVYSLVRPRRYKRDGEMFGSVRVEGHRQLLVSVLKQKLGEANFAEWLKFNPVYNKLDEAEQEVTAY